MDSDTLLDEWEIITRLLPEGWQEAARTHGALTRARQIKDANTLLLVIMMHTAAGLSLRQTVARARRLGLAEMSAVALLKRLRTSGPWLCTLASQMFHDSRFQRQIQYAPGRRVRVVDATTIQEPGSNSTDWRVHYSLGLPSLACDFFEVTDASGGESYKRLEVQPGDVILADRGYCHREGAAHIMDAEGAVVVRLNGSSFPLLDAKGNRIVLLEILNGLEAHEPGEWQVQFEVNKKTYDARLCAIRKSPDAALRARQTVEKEASRKQRKALPDTLALADYTFVLTNLDADFSTHDVLELYRARWQVELAFKRIKSLFAAGTVPKQDPETAKAWIHAKLLAVLLMERLSQEAGLFSPWGFPLRTPQPMARVH